MLSHLVDPLHFCVALVPLAVYLLAIGLINLARRPVILSGAMDAFWLGLGLAGLVIAGPLELFLPAATAFRLGAWIWLLLAASYVLTLTLYALVSRPRILIYNAPIDQLRAVLVAVLQEVDSDARWAGDCVYLPNRGVQFQVEATRASHHVQLAATSAPQNHEAWSILHMKLSQRMATMPPRRNPQGATLILAGLLLLGLCAYWAVHDADAVAQSFDRMIHPGQ